uniref:Uncharacterized protein n=1 Tax=viral metagenome TaxID=1070528 RepID=A0A6M3LG93_9ZZZZ
MTAYQVKIKLKGDYCLEKLETMKFIPLKNRWLFIGRMHSYTFSRLGIHSILVTITPLRKKELIPHQITFGNVNSWLSEVIGRIEIKTKGRTTNDTK